MLDMYDTLHLFCIASAGVDFAELMEQEVIFEVGVTDGMSRCADITLIADNLVECEENFTISLALETMDKPNIMLGAGMTTTEITIDDANSM